MTTGVAVRARVTDEQKNELMFFVELGDESRVCSLVDRLAETNKVDTLKILVDIYKNHKDVSGVVPFKKTIRLIEDVLDVKEMPIDLLLEIYKWIGNWDLYFSQWHHTTESAIADFIPSLSLEKLVKVFQYIPNGILVGATAHHSFKWSSVKPNPVSRRQCLQIAKLMRCNADRMYIIHEMLRNDLVNTSLALFVIKEGLRRSGDLPLGVEYLIETIAERKAGGSKMILLKAIRRITSSNYIGQDKAAQKVIEHMDLTNKEIAELVRDLYYLSSKTAETVKFKIGMLPIDEQVNLLGLGKRKMVNCLTLPTSTDDLLSLARETRKLSDPKTMEAIRNKVAGRIAT